MMNELKLGKNYDFKQIFVLQNNKIRNLIEICKLFDFLTIFIYKVFSNKFQYWFLFK